MTFRTRLRVKSLKPEALHRLNRYFDLSRMTERNVKIVYEISLGAAYAEISTKYGVSLPWVSVLAKKFNLQRKPVAEAYFKRKVLAAYKRGTRWSTILRRYKVPQQTLCRWIEEAGLERRRDWSRQG